VALALWESSAAQVEEKRLFLNTAGMVAAIEFGMKATVKLRSVGYS
jgi:hypothetical protein